MAPTVFNFALTSLGVLAVFGLLAVIIAFVHGGTRKDKEH